MGFTAWATVSGGSTLLFLFTKGEDAGLRLVGHLDTLTSGQFMVESEGVYYEVFLPRGLYFALEAEELANGDIKVPLCDTDGSILCWVRLTITHEILSLSADRSLLSPCDIKPTDPEVVRSMMALLERALSPVAF